MNVQEMELRIIGAAIACIEKDGLASATVRRIAQEAGVNVAAINYYFRSKEQLLERVMETTLDNAFDWSHFSTSEDYPPKARLAAILEHLTEGAQSYPQIARAHFLVPIMEGDTDSPALVKFKAFMERVYEDLEARGARPGLELRLAVMQAVSGSILGPGIMSSLFNGFIGQDLRDKELRRTCIEWLVDRVL